MTQRGVRPTADRNAVTHGGRGGMAAVLLPERWPMCSRCTGRAVEQGAPSLPSSVARRQRYGVRLRTAHGARGSATSTAEG